MSIKMYRVKSSRGFKSEPSPNLEEALNIFELNKEDFVFHLGNALAIEECEDFNNPFLEKKLVKCEWYQRDKNGELYWGEESDDYIYSLEHNFKLGSPYLFVSREFKRLRDEQRELSEIYVHGYMKSHFISKAHFNNFEFVHQGFYMFDLMSLFDSHLNSLIELRKEYTNEALSYFRNLSSKLSGNAEEFLEDFFVFPDYISRFYSDSDSQQILCLNFYFHPFDKQIVGTTMETSYFYHKDCSDKEYLSFGEPNDENILDFSNALPKEEVEVQLQNGFVIQKIDTEKHPMFYKLYVNKNILTNKNMAMEAIFNFKEHLKSNISSWIGSFEQELEMLNTLSPLSLVEFK